MRQYYRDSDERNCINILLRTYTGLFRFKHFTFYRFQPPYITGAFSLHILKQQHGLLKLVVLVGHQGILRINLLKIIDSDDKKFKYMSCIFYKSERCMFASSWFRVTSNNRTRIIIIWFACPKDWYRFYIFRLHVFVFIIKTYQVTTLLRRPWAVKYTLVRVYWNRYMIHITQLHTMKRTKQRPALTWKLWGCSVNNASASSVLLFNSREMPVLAIFQSFTVLSFVAIIAENAFTKIFGWWNTSQTRRPRVWESVFSICRIVS